jgi:hypothetical protein
MSPVVQKYLESPGGAGYGSAFVLRQADININPANSTTVCCVPDYIAAKGIAVLYQ